MIDCCIQLYLKHIRNIPDEFKNSSGNVSFDINKDAIISLNKEFDKLNRFNQITGDAILPFSLPKTKKNNFILNCYGYDLFANFENVIPIPIILILEGWYVPRQNVLYVRSSKGSTKSEHWEVEILNGNNFWKNAMVGLNICDIDLGSYFFNKTNITTHWFTPKYDGTKNVYLPPVHYGRWFGEDTGGWLGNIFPEDLRPLFYVTSILEKGFEHIGWTFISPILQSEEWRKKVIYILKKEIVYTGQGDYFTVNAERNSSNGTDLSFDFMVGTRMQAITDLSSSWNLVTGSPGDGYYLSTHYFNQKLKVKLNLVIDSIHPVSTNMIVRIYDRVNFTIHHEYAFNVPAGGSFNVITESDCFMPGDNAEILFYFQFTSPGNIFNFSMSTGTIDIETCGKRFFINDNIQLNEIINCDLSFLDFFKGILHLIAGGRIITDYDNKKVFVYHADEVELCDGTIPEAFYKESTTDIVVACDSVVNNIGTLEQNRYLELTFKENDPYLESQGFSDENKPYSKTIDLGSILNNEDTETSENPFFHPTGEIDAIKISSTTNEHIRIPAMWDNDEGEMSFDISPRILHIVDYITQIADNPTLFRFWSFGDDLIVSQSLVPFATQLTDIMVQSLSLPESVCENVAYGISDKDLYNLYYSKEIKRSLLFVNIEFLIFINLIKYDYIDGRDVYKIYYEGLYYGFRISNISDKQPCSMIPTPATFLKTV